MDVLYIPGLEDIDAGGEGGGRYRLLRRVPGDGMVTLTDRAVTRVDLPTDDPLKVVLPPRVRGVARDFFLRLVITADEIPEVVFAAPTGETASFEDAEEDVMKCEIGVNHFAFTETDDGIFIVNRKRVDIEKEVEFDPCEGEMDETSRKYKLGVEYSELPSPVRAGYVFEGWFTEAAEGVKVGASDRCKTGVTKLYAHWHVYVDPFVDAICAAKNLTFHTHGDAEWTVDESVFASEGGSARSGRIGDNQRTSLVTTVHGPGRISFKVRTSSESGYDRLLMLMDGTQLDEASGEIDWREAAADVPAGAHELELRYVKDGSCECGSDCAWVDDVAWTPEEGG